MPGKKKAKKKAKLPRGRQTIRTQELDDRILEHISGGETLESFCRKRGTPAPRTVDDWRYKDEAFATAYARAREIGGGVIADRMRHTAKTPSSHQDDVQHRRLIIDTDKWLLARWFPTQYGDRPPEAPVVQVIQLSNADAAREVAMLLATAAARKVIADRDAVKRIDHQELEEDDDAEG